MIIKPTMGKINRQQNVEMELGKTGEDRIRNESIQARENMI